MSRFTGPLSVSFSEARYALLLEPLVWECETLGSGKIVEVPAGFTSDGASVPRFLWWFMPPWGDKGTRAAILHDYLLNLIKDGSAHEFAPTPADADRQFYLALLALRVPKWRSLLCYLGVRAHSMISGWLGIYEDAKTV